MTERAERTFRSALAVIAFVCCVSCAVSLNPWFSQDVRVFEERLLGAWRDSANDLECRFKRGPDGTYLMTMIATDDHERWRIAAALGNIDGLYYLDLVLQNAKPELPVPEWWWIYGVNVIVRLEFEKDKVQFKGLDPDKMKEMIAAGHVRGADIEGTAIEGGMWFHIAETLMIVSSTETLQRFLVQHGRDADLWYEGVWFERM